MTATAARQPTPPNKPKSYLYRESARRPLSAAAVRALDFLSPRAVAPLLFLAAAFIAQTLSAAVVTVDKINKRLLVDGQAFTMKGVNYSPTRPGSRPGSPSNYNFFADAQVYNNDFPLLKTLGANTIRTFDARNATTAALDAAFNNGLYVIMSFPIQNDWDVSAASRTAIQSGFITMVNQFKSHPAVLMWAMGNEVTLTNTSAINNNATWYSLLDECAIASHSADPNHPFTTVNQEFRGLGISSANTLGADPSNVDLWGATIYRGASFGNAFSFFSSTSSKPLWVAEFGSDAYNVPSAAEDQSQQASDLASQWREIAANLSATQSGKGVVGGCVFEWSDEWWKGASTPLNPATIGNGGPGGDAAQDKTADFTNDAYADPNINEEWWGITAVSSTTITKRLRSAFYALKDLWNPVVVTQGPLFGGKIHNFPNPLIAGAGSTRIQINLGQIPESVKLDVFDAARRKIVSLRPSSLSSTLVTADWNGLDENGGTVAPGVYLCRVEVKANNQNDVRYHKIVIIK